MSKKGKWNFLLRDAIAEGLHYPGGDYVEFTSGKRLRVFINNGYRAFTLDHNGKRVRFNIARLVCWLSMGPPPGESYMADHIDRDRMNDDPANLKWATGSENTRNIDPLKMAAIKSWATGGLRAYKDRGASHSCARMTKEIAEGMIEAMERGVGQSQAAQDAGFTQTVASKIKRGAHWIIPSISQYHKELLTKLQSK